MFSEPSKPTKRPFNNPWCFQFQSMPGGDGFPPLRARPAGLRALAARFVGSAGAPGAASGAAAACAASAALVRSGSLWHGQGDCHGASDVVDGAAGREWICHEAVTPTRGGGRGSRKQLVF